MKKERDIDEIPPPPPVSGKASDKKAKNATAKTPQMVLISEQGLQQGFPQLLWIWDWMKVKYEKKDKKDKKEAFNQVSFDASPLDGRLVIHVSRHWP